jgi:hypothetical protein
MEYFEAVALRQELRQFLVDVILDHHRFAFQPRYEFPENEGRRVRLASGGRQNEVILNFNTICFRSRIDAKLALCHKLSDFLYLTKYKNH